MNLGSQLCVLCQSENKHVSVVRTHVMSSVEKLMMVGIKLSLMRMVLMERQSVVGSPMSRQMLSMAILTALGGLARERTSTNCCFLIDLTAEKV